MRGTTITFALGLSICAYACGSDGPGTGPATFSSAQGACEQLCEAEIRCGSTETQGECTADCQGEVAGWVRQDALESVSDCISGLDCAADEDQCLAMVPPLSVHEEWRDKCLMQLATCEGIDGGICSITPGGSGDEGIIVLFAPVVVDEMIACLDAADCVARLQCIQGVFAKYGID